MSDASSAVPVEKQTDETNPEQAIITKVQRVKKAKHALLFSYCGSGYFGLQRNKGFKTIEEEVLVALRDTNIINEEEFDNPHLLYFQRAARTDKGVSAAVQVLSITLPLEIDQKVDHLNQVLPQEIQILGAIRTTRYFDAKNFCDGRTYSYMMPTFALAPPDATTSHSFRADPKLIEEFNNVLRIYRGTHNFHNFTSEKKATDASAMRYILSMECGEPHVKDGLEVAIIRIRGQSFMLHQIRKMLGMAIAVMRGFATVDRLKQAFMLDKIDVPRAPGLGLMLEDVHYDKYNQKFGGDGVHEPISWSRWSDRVSHFRETVIHKVMVETENRDKPMMDWLTTLPLHTYETREPGANPPTRITTPYGAAYFKFPREKAALDKENDDEETDDKAEEHDATKAGEDIDDDLPDFTNQTDEIPVKTKKVRTS